MNPLLPRKTWLDLPWQIPAAGLFVLYGVLAGLGARQFIYSNHGNYHGDFIHFYWAAQAMVSGRDLYTSGQGGYIYPPLVAFLFQPLGVMSERGADLWWLGANAAVNLGALLIAVYAIMRRLALPKSRTLSFAIALLAALLSLDKIRSDFALGQTDALMILSFALILLWFDKNPMLLGLAVGFGACIKYLQLVFVPYFLLRRRYAAVVTSLMGVAVFSLLPALATGWSENLGNLRAAYGGMARMAGVGSGTSAPATDAANISGITWERSMSLTSAFARLDDTVGGHKVVTGGCLVIFAGGLVLGVWLLYRAHEVPLFVRPASYSANNVLLPAEWATLIVLALILSPQTTSRHMVMLLPAYAAAAAFLLSPRLGVPRLGLLVATILLTLSLLLPPPGAALTFWRGIAGASWCAVFFLVMLLRAGLFYANQNAADETTI